MGKYITANELMALAKYTIMDVHRLITSEVIDSYYSDGRKIVNIQFIEESTEQSIYTMVKINGTKTIIDECYCTDVITALWKTKTDIFVFPYSNDDASRFGLTVDLIHCVIRETMFLDRDIKDLIEKGDIDVEIDAPLNNIELLTNELNLLRQNIASLNEERNALLKQVESVTAERDALQGQIQEADGAETAHETWRDAYPLIALVVDMHEQGRSREEIIAELIGRGMTNLQVGLLTRKDIAVVTNGAIKQGVHRARRKNVTSDT